MKAINVKVIISSLRATVDKSLSLTVHTPELSSTDKAAFMDLQGIECEAIFKPIDAVIDDVVNIDKDLSRKSQSQRLRGVLYRLWERNNEDMTSDEFYMVKTEQIINALKKKLDD